MSSVNLSTDRTTVLTHLSNVSALMTGVALAITLVVGLIHLVNAPENYSEASYKGILFALNGVGAFVAAYGIYQRKSWGWWLGLAISGGALVMYVVSRTVGLPIVGIDDEWFEPMGVLSILVEASFIVLFVRGMLKTD